MAATGGACVYAYQKQDEGRTALIYAAMRSHAESLSLLLDGAANKDVTDHVRDRYCTLILATASFSSQLLNLLFVCLYSVCNGGGAVFWRLAGRRYGADLGR